VTRVFPVGRIGNPSGRITNPSYRKNPKASSIDQKSVGHILTQPAADGDLKAGQLGGEGLLTQVGVEVGPLPGDAALAANAIPFGGEGDDKEAVLLAREAFEFFSRACADVEGEPGRICREWLEETAACFLWLKVQ
jgi:hypothetical protein